MGYIYKITNTVNGKMYIGQTSRTIEVRWKEHLNDAFSKHDKFISPLHLAIQKYGKDSFTIEQIEECNNADLDIRERYWIKYYDTYQNGYNADPGGRSNKGQPIYQYARDGTFLREFAALGEAEKTVGGKIMISTKRPHVTNHGYLWRRYKVEKLDIVASPHEKSVHQYSLEGNYITSYKSLAEAARTICGRNTGSFIGVVCRTNRQHAYGYRWSFDKVEHLYDATPSKRLKKVIRITPDTGEEKVYSTIAEAAKDNNASAPNITEACKGHLKTCKGYYWKYYDDSIMS